MDLYKNRTYPPYCTGAGYVLTSDIVIKIWDIIDSKPLLPVEDAFVGLLVHKLNIRPVDNGYLFKERKYDYSGDICNHKHVLVINQVSSSQITELHSKFMNLTTCA